MDLPPLTNVDGDLSTYQKISVSELNTLLRCTRKHDYAYRQGLVLAEPPTYLSKGSYLHLLMERYQRARFEGADFDPDLASKQAQAELLKERGATVLEPDRLEVTAIFREWIKQVEVGEWQAAEHDGIPLIEREFMVDLGWRSLDGEPVLLHGFMDLVTDTAYQQKWMHEHKTAGRAWSIHQLQFAYQGVLYVPALERTTGIRVDGIQYNFFLPKKFEIRQVYVDDARIEHLLAEVQQAIFLRDTGSIVRQPHWGCNDCWYRGLCYAELVGQDTTHIRTTQFKVDEDKVARFTEGV